MSSIVVSPKSPEELKFLTSLFEKLGVSSKVLSEADSEDLGLSVLMKDVDRKETVSEAEIMSKLEV